LKEDLDSFPFLDPTSLPSNIKARIAAMAHSLSNDQPVSWEDLDSLIFQIYGLDSNDSTIVTDTVTFSGPYRSVRERAEQPTSLGERESFRDYLRDMLQPLFEYSDQRIEVRLIEQSPIWGFAPWQFVEITIGERHSSSWKALVGKVAAEANKTGASRVVVRIPGSGLLVGIVNQRRFWTRSRAWLCSLYIEQNHFDAFPDSK
jgi:hypothetical protein